MATSRKGAKRKRRAIRVPAQSADTVPAEKLTLRGRIVDVVAVIFPRRPPVQKA